MKAYMDDCFTYGGQRVELPEEGKNETSFKDIAKQQQLPFCILADFESLLPKVTDERNNNTKNISIHDISGYDYAACSNKSIFPN